MASKNTKAQKAQKSAQPDIITGTPEIEAPVPETPTETLSDLAETRKTPDEDFEAEYGKVMRDRDQTGLLSAILKELFLIRTSRG